QNYRVISGAGDEIQLPASVDVAPYGAFEAADGWVIIAVVTDRSWRALCEALSLEELAADERFATNSGRAEHQDEVVERVAAAARGPGCPRASASPPTGPSGRRPAGRSSPWSPPAPGAPSARRSAWRSWRPTSASRRTPGGPSTKTRWSSAWRRRCGRSPP